MQSFKPRRFITVILRILFLNTHGLLSEQIKLLTWYFLNSFLSQALRCIYRRKREWRNSAYPVAVSHGSTGIWLIWGWMRDDWDIDSGNVFSMYIYSDVIKFASNRLIFEHANEISAPVCFATKQRKWSRELSSTTPWFIQGNFPPIRSKGNLGYEHASSGEILRARLLARETNSAEINRSS